MPANSPSNIDLLFIPRIVSKTKAAVLIDAIGDLVISGKAAPGDRIPPERELAAEAGVSRAIVREALSALSLAGLVERREGSGSFFTCLGDPAKLKSRALALVGRDQDPYVVLGARAAFEPALAELLVSNATADDVDTLAGSHQNLQTALAQRAWDTYFQADSCFHMGLATATHNPCLVRMQEYLTSRMFSPLWRDLRTGYYISNEHSVHVSSRCHAAILAAVKAASASDLQASLHRHFAELTYVLESTGQGE